LGPFIQVLGENGKKKAFFKIRFYLKKGKKLKNIQLQIFLGGGPPGVPPSKKKGAEKKKKKRPP